MYMLVVVMFFVVSLLVLGLVVLVSLSKEVNENAETAYECGFDSKSMARQSFSYRFFLVAILFLVFDVEVVLMLPVPVIMLSSWSFWVMGVFLIILVGGLLYEMWWGSLDWA